MQVNQENSLKKTSHQILILIFIPISLFFFYCSKPEKKDYLVVTNEQVNQVLQQISTHQYGQNRELLTQLSDYVQNMDKSSDTFKNIESKFTKFLESDATLDGKLFVCKQLSIIGTKLSIPTLSEMLVQETTSNMSRYVLERIDSKGAAGALRAALPNITGNMKVGIINSLGEIQDKNCVSQLKRLISDSDPVIAAASVAALGKIGNTDAMSTLANAKDNTEGKLRERVLNSYLMCADKLAALGETEKANAIYEELFAEDESETIRCASIRGMIQTAGKNSGNVIVEVLQNEIPTIQAAAIATIHELPKSIDIIPIANQISNLSDQTKIQLLTALADFGDPKTRKVVLIEIDNSNEQIRVAALKSLSVLGDYTTVNLLSKMAGTKTGIERTTARESLARLGGKLVNETIVAKIGSADGNIKVELIRALGNRFASEETEEVVKATKDSDRKVRIEAFRALSIIAEPQYLPDLVDGLINVPSEPERIEAQKTVVSVALKIEDENKRSKSILAKLPFVENTIVKGSLLEIMGKIGDPNGLPVLRKSIQSDNDETKVAAIRAMSDWPNIEPIDELLNVAKTAENQTHQVLALRGYIRLTDIGINRPAEELITNYKAAMGLAQYENEQKFILSRLAKIKYESALDMSFSYLNNPQLQQEAEQAVVQISRNILENYPEKVKSCLTKVVEISKNQNTIVEAKNILNQIQ